MIKATCYTDDDKIVVGQFDATPWFRDASDKEIIALRNEGYGPGTTADDVAGVCADLDKRVGLMFEYIDVLQRYYMGQAKDIDEDNIVGFICTVDERDAEAWIAQRRPKLRL